jgi:DNA-binding transcriptional LysR family regulator
MSQMRQKRKLHMSQPALSAAIKEFERRLGFALFSRSTRRVELTAQGKLFIGNARRMVSEAAMANRAADAMQMGFSAEVQLQAWCAAALAERRAVMG